MKVKKYITVMTLVLAIGLGYVGSGFSCSEPPPDTNSVQNEMPTI